MHRLAKKEDLEKHYKGIPLGRYGTVKEIADATIYLFSDAGNYVNGEALVGTYILSILPIFYNPCAMQRD